MGDISVREAGRRGGKATAEKYGPEFYQETGRLGGQATKKKYGRKFFEQIGKLGGKSHGRNKKDEG